MSRIMVVDDAAFMRVRCAKLLRDNGYEVVEAENGAQAVLKYQQTRPDAVLMDITMPEMDGLDALVAIRQFDGQARVAMLTAMGQQSVVIEAIKAGAKDFIIKPFQPERVLGAVKKLIG
jgi:two-component system, chemotaxis family, chemotaxis protein CheY